MWGLTEAIPSVEQGQETTSPGGCALLTNVEQRGRESAVAQPKAAVVIAWDQAGY